MDEQTIRKSVRKAYGATAKQTGSCCGSRGAVEASPCSPETTAFTGYSSEQLASIPKGSNLGLGCGNPTALASLRPGETVIDLGSGAGIDCFLASQAVGPEGQVIGVDMTPEMLDRARENAEREGIENVEFRLGEIENLPVADGTANAVISNCVINLSPDKPRVFAEAFRALAPGGRVMVSDIVLLRELPDEIKMSNEAYVACVAGAMKKPEYLAAIERAGFVDVEILSEKPAGVVKSSHAGDEGPRTITGDEAMRQLAEAAAVDFEGYDILAASIHVRAVKPIGD